MNQLAGLDPALIEAAKQGDQAALAQLLTLSRRDLKRFARRTCNTSEDAEDAVQLALWRLQRKIGTLRVINAFTIWLFRIVERECLRLFRANSRTQPLDDFIAEQLPVDPVPMDLRRDLTTALAKLPPIYREVLILRDIEELTAPETAHHLAISVEAVKSRLHRARQMMRTTLTSSGYWFGNGE